MNSGYSVEVIKDSIAPCGIRLTTLQLCYPRFVHAEFMTHRAFSRNAMSSRAIPIAKMVEMVERSPVIPVYWGTNQPGMQAQCEMSEHNRATAQGLWLEGARNALKTAGMLLQVGCHKQIANRVLEPWSWITVLVSATNWDNFLHLRCHKDAQPEIRRVAIEIAEALFSNEPTVLHNGQWHIPYFTEEDAYLASIDDFKAIGTARCARVSYLNHAGKRDIQKDLDLHNQLRSSGHWSAFEHVAQALKHKTSSGNFIGWKQYRQEFEDQVRSKPFTPEILERYLEGTDYGDF